jgi:hypothetical protein
MLGSNAPAVCLCERLGFLREGLLTEEFLVSAARSATS